MATLPKNAHVSGHPCLQAKLSQLRSAATSSRDVQMLVHEISLMVGYEALAGLSVKEDGTVCFLSMFRPSKNLRGSLLHPHHHHLSTPPLSFFIMVVSFML